MPTENSLHIIGLFLFLSGFVIGLGAVTVIDMLGFLGRKSVYWTEATIRTHKVTKPFIWLGISLAVIGAWLFYSGNRTSPVILLHSLLAVILILNGCFLTFYVSPFLLRKEKNEKERITLLPSSLQFKIIISFIISFVCWWTSLFLLVLYLLSLL